MRFGTFKITVVTVIFLQLRTVDDNKIRCSYSERPELLIVREEGNSVRGGFNCFFNCGQMGIQM